MPLDVTRTIASVGSSMAGSGTFSTRTSRLPCQVTARMRRGYPAQPLTSKKDSAEPRQRKPRHPQLPLVCQTGRPAPRSVVGSPRERRVAPRAGPVRSRQRGQYRRGWNCRRPSRRWPRRCTRFVRPFAATQTRPAPHRMSSPPRRSPSTRRRPTRSSTATTAARPSRRSTSTSNATARGFDSSSPTAAAACARAATAPASASAWRSSLSAPTSSSYTSAPAPASSCGWPFAWRPDSARGARVGRLDDGGLVRVLLGHDVAVVALDDGLDVGDLVAGEHQEAARVGPYPLVFAHRQLDELVAAELAALAHEGPRSVVGGVRAAGLDGLVDLPVGRLVTGDALATGLVHAAETTPLSPARVRSAGPAPCG